MVAGPAGAALTMLTTGLTIGAVAVVVGVGLIALHALADGALRLRPGLRLAPAALHMGALAGIELLMLATLAVLGTGPIGTGLMLGGGLAALWIAGIERSEGSVLTALAARVPSVAGGLFVLRRPAHAPIQNRERLGRLLSASRRGVGPVLRALARRAESPCALAAWARRETTSRWVEAVDGLARTTPARAAEVLRQRTADGRLAGLTTDVWTAWLQSPNPELRAAALAAAGPWERARPSEPAVAPPPEARV